LTGSSGIIQTVQRAVDSRECNQWKYQNIKTGNYQAATTDSEW